MIILKRTLLALAVALSVTTAVSADEVTDQLETGKKAYEAGELRSAVEALNFAVAKIQEQMTARLLTLLPEPLPGWQADPAASQSGGMAAMITGTALSRRYFREDGAEVTLNLMADSPLLPMLTMALSMPFMMQANDGMKTYQLKGHRGTIEHKDGTSEYEINLLVGSRLLVQGSGKGLGDQKALEQYLEALDLDAIQKSLTN